MTTMRTTTPTTMKIEAFAKVNLTLDVYGTRPDGYHALRSVVMPISLSDTLTLEPADEFSSDTGYDDDLCLKAARVLANSQWGSDAPVACQKFSIRVAKRIPAGGGLGGGSADAAATLVALNGLWSLGTSRAELAELGAQVGSDVPALVLGGAVLMEGRGERVQSIDACAGCDFSSEHRSIGASDHVRTFNLVLVNPGVPSSTKEVYAACGEREKDAPSPTDAMIAALRTGDLAQIAAATSNDLQAPAVRLHPEIADALASLRTAGATGVTMSGSGSSVFGFAPDAATAARISAELNSRGLRAWQISCLPSASASIVPAL